MTATPRRKLMALDRVKMNVTLGPFVAHDLAGTASTFLAHGYFNTATALSLSTREVKMSQAGRIVGMILATDADVTAGTLTGRASINGTAVAFNGGAVEMNTTLVQSDSSFVEFESGIPFVAGDTIGMNVNSVSMTPTTLNCVGYLVLALDPV
jgi:hypothetical protein